MLFSAVSLVSALHKEITGNYFRSYCPIKKIVRDFFCQLVIVFQKSLVSDIRSNVGAGEGADRGGGGGSGLQILHQDQESVREESESVNVEVPERDEPLEVGKH